MAQSTKIYDYNNQKVRRTLQSTLQKSSREASVADLVSRTGLPNYQVDQTLRTMLDENRGRLKATDSGELLYYFPEGFRNFKTGVKVRVARLLHRGVRSLARAATYLFKMWIMVMLVGYFILFVVLLIAALIASIAGSAASQGNNRSRSRGGGFGTFFLTTRLLQLFVSLWFYSDGGRGRSRNRNWRSGFRTRGRNGQPLHQSVFAFVFGGEDPDKDRENYLKRTAIRFIQENKGVITIDELIRLTGKTPEDANIMINDMLLEYEGNPSVTEEGTVYYQFGSLMATTKSDFSAIPFTANRLEMKPFNDNPQKTNRWIAFFNGFNILFGTFFLYFSLNPPIGMPVETLGVLPKLYMIIGGFLSRLGDPTGFLLVGLGIIPVIFSLVFFAVTGLRRLADNRRNEKARRGNLRKTVYETIFDGPDYILPGAILPHGDKETPQDWEERRQKDIERYAAYKGGDISQEPDGKQYFIFPELTREKEDMVSLRKGIDPSQFGVGEIVYDSGDN